MCFLRGEGDMLLVLGWNAGDAKEEFALQLEFAKEFRSTATSAEVDVSPTSVPYSEGIGTLSKIDRESVEHLSNSNRTVVRVEESRRREEGGGPLGAAVTSSRVTVSSGS